MKKFPAKMVLSLSLMLMSVIQSCGVQSDLFATHPSAESTSTVEVTPTPIKVTSTSTLLPVLQPIEPTPDPYLVNFENFEMKSETAGWGIGGIMDDTGEYWQKLLHTSDGGMTWLDVTPPYPDPYLLIDDHVFLDYERAWIVNSSKSEDESSYFPILWRTVNGGKSWEQSIPVTFPRTPAGPYIINFEDEQRGELGVVMDVGAGTSWLSSYETSDGGRRWMQKPDTTENINDRNEFLSTLPVPDGIEPPEGCWQFRQSVVSFSEQESILQVLCGEDLFIYHSHSEGKTWDAPFVESPFLFAELVDFVDVHTGWFKGVEDSPSNIRGSGLYVTHDGGETWNEIIPTLIIDELDPSQYPNDNPVELIYEINFIDSEMGFALSDYGYDYSLILKTTDGGLTWSSWVPHWQPSKQ